MRTRLIRLLGATGLVTMVSFPTAGLQIASASQVPPSQFNCGDPSLPPAPCNQTAHFSSIDAVGTPPPPGASCPDFVNNDFLTIVGDGNGIEHSIVNNALDGWFTSTFTGQVTLTFYPPTSVDQTDPNNPVITGAPDAGAPVLMGRLTQWFGGSFNNRNFVNHGTNNFTGVDSASNQYGFHSVFHVSSSANPTQPLHFVIMTNCTVVTH